MIKLKYLTMTDLQMIALIGETGNLTRTAEKLNLTQPAISHRLQNLAIMIGGKPAFREGRNFVLTEAGNVLLELFAKMRAEYKNAEDRLNDLGATLKGPLIIGTSDTLGIHFLPEHVRAFNQAHPAVSLTLTSKPSRMIAEQILEDKIDVGVALTRVLDQRFTFWPLTRRKDCIIVAPETRFADRQGLSLLEIKDEPFVTLDKQSQSRYFTVEWFRKRGLTVRIRMELGSFEMVKKYVAMGFGFSIVPEFAVQTEVAAGRLVQIAIEDRVPFQEIGVFVPKNKYPTLAVQAFIAFLRSRFGD